MTTSDAPLGRRIHGTLFARRVPLLIESVAVVQAKRSGARRRSQTHDFDKRADDAVKPSDERLIERKIPERIRNPERSEHPASVE
jgi:hypothetical protein